MRLSKETGGLRIQFATQFTEAFQRQHLFGIDMQTMRFQQRGQRVGIRGIEARMYVVNTETELIAQYARGAKVSGDHRLFYDTVSDTARFRHNIQYFAFSPSTKR